MKKLLFFVESLSGGGAEKVLVDLVRILSQKRYAITVCALTDVGVYQDELRKYCTYTFILPNPDRLESGWQKKWYALRYKIVYKMPSKWAYRYCISGNYDVEIAFIEGYATKLISGSRSNAKKISWVHIDLFANHWTSEVYASVEQEIGAYKRYDHIVCVSETVRDAFMRRFEPMESLEVRYNPVDELTIQKQSEGQINVPEKRKAYRLISVGRLEDQKGFDRLIDVAKQLEVDGFSFELYIVGEGSQRQMLEEKINLYKINEYVHLVGFTSNPYAWIHSADLFVCSSRSEGFSTVVTEALILGKAVVTTDCSGMEELLGTNNEYGLITENDTQALYEGVKRLLEDKGCLQKYTKKGLERGQKFNGENAVRQIETLL